MSRAPDPADALGRRLAALPARLAAESLAALRMIGADVCEEARTRLADASGGPPSAPGAEPRDPTGALAASLAVAEQEGAVTVTCTSPHAAALEYGTRRMAARPFLRPARDAVRPAALARCRAALARAAGEPER